MHHENDHPNLKVDTLSIQNNRKLKSYTVEFFSGKFLSAPTGIRTHDPQIWSPMLYHWAMALIYLDFLGKNSLTLLAQTVGADKNLAEKNSTV